MATLVSRKGRILHRVSTALLCVGTILVMVGMARPYWIEYDEKDYDTGNDEEASNEGIFEKCMDDSKVGCVDFDFDEISAKQRVVIVMCGMATAFGFISSVAAIVQVLIVQMSPQVISRRGVVASFLVSAIGSLLSAMCIVSAVVTYGDRIYRKWIYIGEYNKQEAYLSSSFYICLAAAIFFLAGFVVVCQAYKHVVPQLQSHQITSADDDDKQTDGHVTHDHQVEMAKF